MPSNPNGSIEEPESQKSPIPADQKEPKEATEEIGKQIGVQTDAPGSQKRYEKKKNKKSDVSTHPPWIVEGEFPDGEMSTLIRYHYEILNFCKWVLPTPEERAMRQKIIDKCRSVVSKLFPKAKVPSCRN